MLKVYILNRCQYCDGKAYVPVGIAVDDNHEKFTRYLPCDKCQGTVESASGSARLTS